MKWLFAVVLTLVIVGCSTTQDEAVLNASKTIDEKITNLYLPMQYVVHNTGRLSSSSGDRLYDVEYIIKDEQFLACEGQFNFSGTDLRTERCTRQTLEEGRFYGLTMTQIAQQLDTTDLIFVQNRNCFINTSTQTSYCFDERGAIVSYATDTGREIMRWEAKYETERLGQRN